MPSVKLADGWMSVKKEKKIFALNLHFRFGQDG